MKPTMMQTNRPALQGLRREPNPARAALRRRRIPQPQLFLTVEMLCRGRIRRRRRLSGMYSSEGGRETKPSAWDLWSQQFVGTGTSTRTWFQEKILTVHLFGLLGAAPTASAPWKLDPKQTGTPNGRQNISANAPIVLSDSDSDSEGFREEPTPTHSKSNGKASSDSLKTGGKASSDSLKTGGKASSFSNGEAGKGGKTFSAGKGGKGSASTAMPAKSDAELKLELDMPSNSRILMNCEATELLQQIHEHMAILSEDPKIKIPESFDRTFQFAKEGNHFTSAKSVKEVLDPLKKSGVTDGEICMIANIGPETIEEVYALVPSLKATRSLNEDLITEALTALANIKAPK
ncbi:hypothetical protein BRADI_3g56497v3 [Brachypodium distachyon]|uniref:RNA polymerase Rpb4/RPC9 core domain-containing protein n=1 Tax=Brachypodium distachyon TaxID=15368 RepID=A0A2K2D5D2_BRADI|nr:hypothetical protein BRADI_3g56497v3 [Brachypodium distachyon]